LGNVTTQVSDKKAGSLATNSIKAKILSYQQYYPFGWNMPGRSKNADKARFDFQKQETDKEWLGGNAVAYKYRFHDPRLGRFLSVDPLKDEYLYNSSYAFSENRVIDGIELEGAEWQLIPFIIIAKLGRPILKGAGRLFRAGAKPKSIPKVKPQAVPKANPTIPHNVIPKPTPKLPGKPIPILPPVSFEDYFDHNILEDLKTHEPVQDKLTPRLDEPITIIEIDKNEQNKRDNAFDKMDDLLARPNPSDDEYYVYQLTAKQDGDYICHTCPLGKIHLKAGEKWKYGKAKGSEGYNRYSKGSYEDQNFTKVPITGLMSNEKARAVEKAAILGYRHEPENTKRASEGRAPLLVKPPGNKQYK
jgi:RHS repeat-associated protein